MSVCRYGSYICTMLVVCLPIACACLILGNIRCIPEFLEWLQAVVDTAPAISQNLSSGEVVDPQEADMEVSAGVSPIEVERKLHELVEARQHERIKELEAALECAMKKLRDQELEVSWWKDTARVVSQHLPAPSRLKSRHQDPKIFTC